ncbi:dihydroorotate dehydrogenase-like protein [Desulfofustis glycolicus]|uniref:Dihydroorotate dehydrogenase (Fumarate) n=1 Tax=Desulfofustis glycolicus DSM 9705 TaxID=1121409 RepID=A0A1M5VJ54_9BACT|nr:dihydroorotate dehydrogenase-like protein [Desulfofustis glycolicus]MCB2217624.1 dihydroorotate dehydrogenase-like protein [Desulfobulbaceae bacterium]SHH75218.1 dihydroorotate dehydrogenase (fumarate) [Desulfofustis glycolicus DSM 9705]
MTDLTTNYLGLKLKNPVVAGSCGLTGSLVKIRELADAGVGAVVLKSLFEEQIEADLKSNLEVYQTDYPEAYDYIKEYTRDSAVSDYLDLISDAKKDLDIPVIASLNCVTAAEWTSFAKRIAKAGADALEINISLLPSDPRKSCSDYEQIYFDVVNKVTDGLAIPITLKMSSYSSSLASLVSRLFWTGKVGGFVLFNRYYRPDIDIDSLSLTSAGVLSEPAEISTPLRWVALLSGMVEADFAASTGVHDGAAAVKLILAGARTVQTVSALYRNGAGQATKIISDLETWMQNHSFTGIEQFRGRLSYSFGSDQSAFERIQFMKHYAGIV